VTVPGKLVSAPKRLASQSGELGELVRAARAYEPRLDQGVAFAGLMDRARGRGQRRWGTPVWAFVFASLCVAAASAVFFVRHAGGPEPSVERSLPASAPRPDAPSAEPRSAEASELAATQTLSAGETRLEDGSRVRLAPTSSARVERGPRGVRIGLEQGTITVDVAKQAEGQTFEVQAKTYRFVAIGTAFVVSASGERVELDVQEGRVAVFRGESELARVAAGEAWSPPRELAAVRAAEAPTPQHVAQPNAPDDENCLALARARRARDAESCFIARATRGGLGAEMALFELSRLRSDVLGDPAGALVALKEYRERFPNGSLRTEVDVARVHLLARLGRHAELVAESAELLQGPTGRERGGELRMLRANALRTGLKDCRSAEREYAEVETAGGKFAADAAFYRGVCLQALGDTTGAARAYRRYLEQPGRPRAAEAQRRLHELAP
jgi:hypothetical protein